MEGSSMPPPPPRRKEDVRKQLLSGLLSAGPGNSPLLPAAVGPAAGHDHSAATLAPGETPADKHELSDWKSYWDDCKQVELPDRGGIFNVYCAGSSGPILLAVHGAGYTGLTWSLVAASLKDRYRIVAPDLRGHGLTAATPETDFSKAMLADDVCALWHALFPPPAPTPDAPAEQVSCSLAASPAGGLPVRPPPAADPRATVLVGHSMGGAIVVWAAVSKKIPCLAGCVVVDVVEGTAVAALPRMMSVIDARPTRFPSPAAAVSWALKSGMSRCKAAASVSLPSQLRPASLQPSAPTQVDASGNKPPHTTLMDPASTITEDDEEGQEAEGNNSAPQPEQPAAPASVAGQQEGWYWRTPLAHTQPYWHEWYTGHSDALLSLPVPKMLLLAGTDRLDKPLTIGQMQGKFQLVVLPTAGHAIQEDDAPATSAALDHFVKRQRIGQPPLAVPTHTAGIRPVLPVVAGPLFDGKH